MTTRDKPLVTGRTAEWHFDHFVEFTSKKLAVGEPSPHLAIMGHLTQAMTQEDRLYALGCYAATYCLPSAQVMWTLLPLAHVRAGAAAGWISEHWPGIVTRTERRCVRSPAKMTECINSLVSWIYTEFPKDRK